MAMSTKQLAVLSASRGYIKAKGAAVKAFQALCGDDLTTDDAKKLVSELLTAIRTINGVVASVKACSDAKSAPWRKRDGTTGRLPNRSLGRKLRQQKK
jgi:hypothetical protein